MHTTDTGTLPGSDYYFHTPSEDAKKFFYYLVSCGHYHTINGYSFHRDFYPYMLFLYVKGGMIRLDYMGNSYQVRAGEFFFIDCQEKHFYYTPKNCEFYYIHFDGLNCHQIYPLIYKNFGCLFHQKDYPELIQILKRIIYINREEQQITEAGYSRLIADLLFGIMAPEASSDADAEDIPAVRNTISYIQNHLDENLTIQLLAERVFLSPYYFSRLFKKKTGYSPYEYIIISRINRAKYLLKTTKLPLEEIAAASGYHSAGRFINAFSERVGIPPERFRRLPL